MAGGRESFILSPMCNERVRNEALYRTGDPTPVENIPVEFRAVAILPRGKTQIIDTRLCYNWDPGIDGGELVECGSVAAHAER